MDHADDAAGTEQDDIERMVRVCEHYTAEINSTRRWIRPLVLTLWCIFWLTLLYGWLRGSSSFVALLCEPLLLWLLRALFIVRQSPACDTPDHLDWWLVLSLVTTQPLVVPVRPLIERHRGELTQRQGCYVRLLDHWRQAAIDTQTIWAL